MSAFEDPRLEAVHIFGTDRMSTEDLLGYFAAEGLAPPLSVEWINDSSANVVFSDASAAAAALEQRTVPLPPNAQGVDTISWRTLPTELVAAGKGLQLLFRHATTKARRDLQVLGQGRLQSRPRLRICPRRDRP